MTIVAELKESRLIDEHTAGVFDLEQTVETIIKDIETLEYQLEEVRTSRRYMTSSGALENLAASIIEEESDRDLTKEEYDELFEHIWVQYHY